VYSGSDVAKKGTQSTMSNAAAAPPSPPPAAPPSPEAPSAPASTPPDSPSKPALSERSTPSTPEKMARDLAAGASYGAGGLASDGAAAAPPPASGTLTQLLTPSGADLASSFAAMRRELASIKGTALFEFPVVPSELINMYHTPYMTQRVVPNNCVAASAMLIGLINQQEFDYHSILDRVSNLISPAYWNFRLSEVVKDTTDKFVGKEYKCEVFQSLIDELSAGFATLLTITKGLGGHTVVLMKDYKGTPMLLDLQVHCYAVGLDRIKSYVAWNDVGMFHPFTQSKITDEVPMYTNPDLDAKLSLYTIHCFAIVSSEGAAVKMTPSMWLAYSHVYRTGWLRHEIPDFSVKLATYIKEKLDRMRTAMMEVLLVKPGIATDSIDAAHAYMYKITMTAFKSPSDYTPEEQEYYKDIGVRLLLDTINKYMDAERTFRPTMGETRSSYTVQITIVMVIRAAYAAVKNRQDRINAATASIAAYAAAHPPPASGGARSTSQTPPSEPTPPARHPSFARHRPSTRRQLI
jgi:hypothetical protein